MMKKIEDVRPLIFGICFGIFILVYISSNWNEESNAWSKAGTGFTIGGVFLAGYIALWAFENEVRRRKHESEENKYYKINVKYNLDSLLTKITYAYQTGNYWRTEESLREDLHPDIISNIKKYQVEVFEICEDLQILNLNPFISSYMKDLVGQVMRESKRIFPSEPDKIVMSVYCNDAKNLMTGIKKLLDAHDFKEFRGFKF